jgi:hypothetical protein
MPTVLRKDGFRFFFFSNEGSEPLHIHAEHGKGYAKYWLEPIGLSYSVGLKSRQLWKLRNLVVENQDLFITFWYDYFN